MRSQDLHMAATIDMATRVIMVSGAIDQDDSAIVMTIPIPEPGAYTLVKAETNLTDSPWDMWLITLGEGVSLPAGDPTNLLLSRQFKKGQYFPEHNAIMFYDGEVRPGDAVIKIMRFNVQGNSLPLAHGSRGKPKPKRREEDDDILNDIIGNSTFIDDPNDENYAYNLLRDSLVYADRRPKVEVIAPTRIIGTNESDVATMSASSTSVERATHSGFFGRLG